MAKSNTNTQLKPKRSNKRKKKAISKKSTYKPVSRGYRYVEKVMLKYYGYGERNRRFKTKDQLKAEARRVFNELRSYQIQGKLDGSKEVALQGKVTIANIKRVVGLLPVVGIKPPILPDGWNRVRPYWELDSVLVDILAYPSGLIVIAPEILGYSGTDMISLRCGESYTYESTFQPYVDWQNDNRPDESKYRYVRLDNLSYKKNSKVWQVECYPCDEFGEAVYYDYKPKDKLPMKRTGDVPVIDETAVTSSGKPKKEISEAKVPEVVPVVKSETGISETDKYKIETEAKYKSKVESLERMLEKGLISKADYMDMLIKL